MPSAQEGTSFKSHVIPPAFIHRMMVHGLNFIPSITWLRSHGLSLPISKKERPMSALLAPVTLRTASEEAKEGGEAEEPPAGSPAAEVGMDLGPTMPSVPEPVPERMKILVTAAF